MSKKPIVSVLSVVCVMGVTAVAQAAFVAGGPKGGEWDNFEDGVVDTDTWTGTALESVSESGGQLKLVQTTGFNGSYGTAAPYNTTLVNVGEKARAILTRIETTPESAPGIDANRHDRVSTGFSITTNVTLRTCDDQGDYVCITENSQNFGRIQARADATVLDSDDANIGTASHNSPNINMGTAYEYRIHWKDAGSARWAVQEVGGSVIAKGVLDWSDGACGDGSCWPAGLGVQFYHHNGGTLLVNEVEVYPEPASLGLLAAGSLLMLRRRRRA